MKGLIYKSSNYILFNFLLLGFILNNSCKKQLDINGPFTSTNADNIYTSDATAAAVLTGIYAQMSANNFSSVPGFNSLSLFAGLSADEITLYSGAANIMHIGYYANTLNSNVTGYEFWNSTYPIIFFANSVIDGLNNSINLTPTVQKQLMGEAKFIRAFCYFYLVNLFGDVPLVISTDWKVNSALPRSTKTQIYEQIVADLKEAQNLLSSNYLKADVIGTTFDRVRPTKWAATALLARTYLYIGDYVHAEEQASSVINNSSLFSLTTLNNVFLKNSAEAIWQLQPVISGQNTQDARLFILPASGIGFNFPVYLSTNVMSNFETGDQRKTNWINKYTDTIPDPDVDYFYPYKYKVNVNNAPVTEYVMVFRLAEQYLIRAEARAKQNNFSGAISDLNVIRARAELPNLSSSLNQAQILIALAQENRIEFFAEWGHRWFDLKRTDQADVVLGPIKGTNWQTTDQLYPLPLIDLQRNPNLLQNPGY